MRRSATLAAATILLLTVVVLVGGGGTGTPAVAAELQTFAGCDDLRDRIVADALEHVGPYGLEGVPMPMPLMDRGAEGVDAAADVAESAPADGSSAGGAVEQEAGGDEGFTSETGTNVQVAGVDEPDHVKLSGDLLAVIDGTAIRLLDVSGDTPTVVGTIRTEEELYPSTMLAAGDRLVVLGSPFEPMSTESELRSEQGIASDAIGPWQRPDTAVAVYDVSSPATPRKVDSLRVDGSLTSARLTGGRVLLVTTGAPSVPFVHPSGGAGAEERAEEANREAVRESTIDQWIAGVTFEDGTRRAAAACDRVGVPTEIVSWQHVSITAFDPAAPLDEVQGAAAFGAGDTVYASRDRVYVAGHQWEPDTQESSVAVHGFAIEGAPDYLASGSVPGNLLNQFAMDRYEGHLRIATTTTKPDGQTDSRITVLAEGGDQLTVAGTVTGLGRPGETIRGIRFLGPVGYVVTFQQTDPLYTIDLSDPTAPRTRGELKIPGYSAYLHPIADGLLLGIGSAATDDGRITGAQISLFDVSDLDAPTRIDVLEVPGTSTPVEWDHHAFTWVGAESLAAIPLEGAGWTAPVEPQDDATEPGSPGGVPPEHTAGVLLLEVSEGRLVQVATVAAPPSPEGWTPGFQRTIAHDGTLLAVSPEHVWRVSFGGEVLGRTSLR